MRSTRTAAASGFPYALVDRVVEIEPGRRGYARKVVSANEPYFAGHFPGVPVMPGVLLCEALAQLAALVVAEDDATAPPPRVREMGRARFRHPVFPGDALELRVEADPGPPWPCRGSVAVAGRVAVEAEFLLAATDEPYVHPTAIVARTAELARGVRIGPYAVIGPWVQLGARTWVGAHAVVQGHTTVGTDNRIFPFASLGGPPQDLKYRGEPSRLEIGCANAIREYVTMHPGTEGGGMVTRVGSGSLFMVSAHVGHDSDVGDTVVLANSAALAGHVAVEAHAIIGGLAGVHQFTRIGESAMCGGGAMVSQDVPPFCTVSGNRARLFGLNLVGLKRRGFSDDTVRALKRAYRALFLAGERREEAVEHARATAAHVPEVAQLVAFVEVSRRGVCRP